MAWNIEKGTNDIVINGWENGIADDPYEGLADMRNINILSTPKEAPVGFATAAVTLPPIYNTTSFTASSVTNTLTTATTAGFYAGMAIVINSYTTTSAVATLLVVGGGGGGGAGGGSQAGGGGGSGQVAPGTSTLNSGNSYTITVGQGGASATAGSNSSALSITAIGGGNGASYPNNGGTGASGGGGSAGGGFGGSGGTGSAGNNGGNGVFNSGMGTFASGGGGGSGTAGSNGSGGAGGAGGNGTSSSITGSALTYGGGGGGAGSSNGGAGGTGGGGAGGSSPVVGTQNTGGGGGGIGTTGGGAAGGSGVVVISVPAGIVSNIVSSVIGVNQTLLSSLGAGATTGTLLSNWISPTITLPTMFSTGESRNVLYTNGSPNISWTGALSSNETDIIATGVSYNRSGGNDIWEFAVSATWQPYLFPTTNLFYVGNITPTTFQLYSDLGGINLVTIPASGSGTFTTVQLANPFDSCQGINYQNYATSKSQLVQMDFIIDSVGQVWYIGNGSEGYGLNVLQFCGNTNHTTLVTAGSLGIVVFKGYLFAFIEGAIDYISLSTLFGSSGPSGAWVIDWQNTTPTTFGHKAVATTDDAVYFCNNQTLGSLLEAAGETFNPTNTATYTYNTDALSLPAYDFCRCVAQLGVQLLVGGAQNYIYPWDRVSTSFNYPLIVAEANIAKIVSTNSNAYVFAGNRGRIYITNGANIQLYKKFPDQLSGTETPYYVWGDAQYFRNQLYFGISCTDNSGNAISNFAGVWSLSLELANTFSSIAYGSASGPLKLLQSLSYGTYAGTVPVIIPMGNVNPTGNGLYIGWINGTGGIDYCTSTPYTNYQSYIDTDMIPVGTFFKPETNAQIEYKLSKPLVTGESIRIAWRGNLTSPFTTVTTFTKTGLVADATKVNFEKQQWAQFRVSMSSTVTTPSYDRLQELRLR